MRRLEAAKNGPSCSAQDVGPLQPQLTQHNNGSRDACVSQADRPAFIRERRVRSGLPGHACGGRGRGVEEIGHRRPACRCIGHGRPRGCCRPSSADQPHRPVWPRERERERERAEQVAASQGSPGCLSVCVCQSETAIRLSGEQPSASFTNVAGHTARSYAVPGDDASAPREGHSLTCPQRAGAFARRHALFMHFEDSVDDGYLPVFDLRNGTKQAECGVWDGPRGTRDRGTHVLVFSPAPRDVGVAAQQRCRQAG